MFRLLAKLAAIALSLALLAVNSSSAHATSYNVTVLLYHPDGSATVNNLLTCGWHDSCVNGPDGGGALDWVPANAGVTQVWIRLLGIGGPGPTTWVARAQSYYTTFPCKQIQAEVMRISDWARFGYVHEYHSYGNSNPNYFNVFANTSGAQASAVGGYILPNAQDNCSSFGDHTHQFYESGPNDIFYSKNTAISSTCDLCYTPYPIWNTYEYGFQFYS